VPDRSFYQQINRRLRDDILAQMRTARRPLTTTQLRENAASLPVRPGARTQLAPPQEQVYRALCQLRAQGKVRQHPTPGRDVAWVIVRGEDDDEIARLEAALLFSPSGIRQQVPSPSRRWSP
jgi:hypothetical protein